MSYLCSLDDIMMFVTYVNPQINHPPLWVVEGVGEYVAGNVELVEGVDDIVFCSRPDSPFFPFVPLSPCGPGIPCSPFSPG